MCSKLIDKVYWNSIEYVRYLSSIKTFHRICNHFYTTRCDKTAFGKKQKKNINLTQYLKFCEYLCKRGRDENRKYEKVYIIFYSFKLLTSNWKILFHSQQQLVTFNTFISIRLKLVLNFKIQFFVWKNYHLVILLQIFGEYYDN